METYTNNGAIDLADTMSFNVAPTAPYVTDRRSVTCVLVVKMIMDEPG